MSTPNFFKKINTIATSRSGHQFLTEIPTSFVCRRQNNIWAKPPGSADTSSSMIEYHWDLDFLPEQNTEIELLDIFHMPKSPSLVHPACPSILQNRYVRSCAPGQQKHTGILRFAQTEFY